MTEQLQYERTDADKEAERKADAAEAAGKWGTVALEGFESTDEAVHIPVQQRNSEVSHPDVRVEH